MKIIIADDHTLFRQAFRMLLNEIPDTIIVGEASDGEELLKLIESTYTDLVFLDIRMPGINGLELAKRISLYWPKIKICIMTMFEEEHYFASAIEAGASGFMLKPLSIEELKKAINTIIAGGHYFPLTAYRKLKNRTFQQTPD